MLLRVLLLFALLYLFLSAITLMGGSFKLLGKGVAEQLIQTTANPFVGLLIGLLVTSIVQSSSVTTAMVVALVSGGALTITNAVPIVMGANMGTTITCALVSVGHITRNDEFERAYAGATVHDFFNVLSVAILLPLEITFHWMEKVAGLLSGVFYGMEATTFESPVKMVVKPFAKMIQGMLSDAGLSPKAVGIFGIIIAMIFIFIALTYMVKLMRVVFASRVEGAVHKIFGANAYLTLVIGIGITALIQSSSITTSILIPLLGAGVITLEHAFPITVGANIGTTVTAILASLAGNQAGLTIAFVHLVFNLSGTILFFVIAPMRRIPIFMARKMSSYAVRNKKIVFIYLGLVFFIIPLLGVFLTKVF